MKTLKDLIDKETMDANVESVVASLRRRSRDGYVKYGCTTERNDLSVLQWMRHLQEELMDATIYIEAWIRKMRYEAKDNL